VIASARSAIAAGEPCPPLEALATWTSAHVATARRARLRRVINATGVIVNTNLGRSPLSEEAIAAATAVAGGYSNLEFDLETGERGSRHVHVRDLLCELTGAEDALVVNNNAAAVLVVLAALAAQREVIVSRGELVEIGGGFRVPDVMRQSGARLVEVGTTNRTRLTDYAEALTLETALLLAVHPSNFRISGFTETPALRSLAELAHARGVQLVHDLGSGSLGATEEWGLAHEPTPMESIAAGADVVCFSGDKLLGGPQAGLIVGRATAVERIGRHPLMRAVRIDKLTLAALEATLRLHRDGLAASRLPVWRDLATSLEAIRERAEAWVAQVRGWGFAAEAIDGLSTIGGGSLPGETIPTVLCALDGPEALAGDARSSSLARPEVAALAARLRLGEPPVVARVSRDRLLLDPRTVAPEEDVVLQDALRRALMG
jgi:L-seryl-tRNA(Ser) seleniumtransferase